MKNVLIALAALLALASCGADGAPVAPSAKFGVAVSGDVQIGVTG